MVEGMPLASECSDRHKSTGMCGLGKEEVVQQGRYGRVRTLHQVGESFAEVLSRAGVPWLVGKVGKIGTTGGRLLRGVQRGSLDVSSVTWATGLVWLHR